MSAKSKRKAMRSGTAVCPISKYRGALVEHHINGREVADAEWDWNKVWLSPNVHDMVHRGEIVIEGWFMSSEGRTLIWRNADEETITGVSSAPPTYRKPISG